jgi:hypothetical protein
MKHLAPLAAVLLLAACAPMGGADRGPGGRPLLLAANPSAVIAAETAFARLAREKGQWTAFRETASDDAVLFVPQRVLAQAWLKGRANPPVSVTWQPHEVWMSCDGRYGVTRGAWQRPNSVGYFTTVWRRDNKGAFRWVLDQGDVLAQPLAAPEMITAKVAECGKGATPLPASTPVQGADRKDDHSPDHTLQWTSVVNPDGSREFDVHFWNGTAFDRVMSTRVSAGID